MTIAYPDCGTLENLPQSGRAGIAVCRLCRSRLEVVSGRSIAAGLACAFSVFVLLFPANLAPLGR
jgi:paraquat-inducible protein A